MPWVVGIDEAGYGPNLGPLVQAAVALYLPDDDHAGWETLRPVVRRCGEKTDKWRMLIDDSKKVYTRGGFDGLEHAILVAVPPLEETVSALLPHITLPWVRGDLDGELWFDPADAIPQTNDLESVWVSRRTVGDCWGSVNAPCGFGPFLAAVVPAPRFNRICDKSGSKATVLSRGIVELIPATLGEMESDGEPVIILCDKIGGRNFYAAMLQEAFPNGWIVPECESAAESRYRVDMFDRPVTVTFRPRADGDSVAVALASMLCKYLREVCMRQFNRFWANHVPGIKPTAGYPLDAKRFFAEIQPAMKKLGLTDDQVWRKK